MNPLRAFVALLGILTVCLGSPEAAATPEARRATTRALPPLGAVLSRDLAILELRVHAAAERLAWLDVGVYPVPARRARR